MMVGLKRVDPWVTRDNSILSNYIFKSPESKFIEVHKRDIKRLKMMNYSNTLAFFQHRMLSDPCTSLPFYQRFLYCLSIIFCQQCFISNQINGLNAQRSLYYFYVDTIVLSGPTLPPANWIFHCSNWCTHAQIIIAIFLYFTGCKLQWDNSSTVTDRLIFSCILQDVSCNEITHLPSQIG